MGDHESSAGVVTDETTAGQVAFNLQGKQIPRERTTERQRENKRQKTHRNRRECESEKRLMHALQTQLLKAIPLPSNYWHLYTHSHTHSCYFAATD